MKHKVVCLHYVGMKHYLYLNRKFSLEGCLSLSCEYIEIYQLFKMTFKDFPFPSSPPQTVLAVCYYKTIFLLFKIVTKFISEDCLLPAPAQSSARCCSQPWCQAHPEPRTPNPPQLGPAALPCLLQRSRLAANTLMEGEL